MKKVLLMTCLAGVLVAFVSNAADEPVLNSHLELLRPLLGRTMKGTLNSANSDKPPMVDVQKWERALNGQAVRLTHSINDGFYGGETMFVWDEKRGAVVYYYFTTEGYMTSGTMVCTNSHYICTEKVNGSASGVQEVRSTSEVLPGGRFHVKAEYFKDGQWSFGHEITYCDDPKAAVVFK